jgi:hypothetical protein
LYGHLVEEQPGLPEHNSSPLQRGRERPASRRARAQARQYYYYDKFTLNARYGYPPPTSGPILRPPRFPRACRVAFKQVEFLKRYKHVVNWLIENRMIENGEFGGGLSDDGDLSARG